MIIELPEVPKPLGGETLSGWVERWRIPFNDAVALVNRQLRGEVVDE